MTLRLNLGQYLKDHGISAYRLVQEVRGQVAPNTVYALARKPAQRIDLETVDKLLGALGRMRGEAVELSDVLEKAEDSPPPLQEPPVPGLGPRKVFTYGGYRVHIGPGPSAEDIVAELRGH